MVNYVCFVVLLISLIANVFFACGHSKSKSEDVDNDSLPIVKEIVLVTNGFVN